MRELGGDLLEAYGGVAALPLPYTGEPFPSELADLGVTGSIEVATSADNRTVGPVAFTDIRCASQQNRRHADLGSFGGCGPPTPTPNLAQPSPSPLPEPPLQALSPSPLFSPIPDPEREP